MPEGRGTHGTTCGGEDLPCLDSCHIGHHQKKSSAIFSVCDAFSQWCCILIPAATLEGEYGVGAMPSSQSEQLKSKKMNYLAGGGPAVSPGQEIPSQ